MPTTSVADTPTVALVIPAPLHYCATTDAHLQSVKRELETVCRELGWGSGDFGNIRAIALFYPRDRQDELAAACDRAGCVVLQGDLRTEVDGREVVLDMPALAAAGGVAVPAAGDRYCLQRK